MALNWKTWAPAAGAVGLIIIAAKMVRSPHQDAPTQAQAVQSVRVVVVKDAVPRGQELREDQLSLSAIGGTEVPSNAFGDRKAVIGRIATANLSAGQRVTEDVLAPQGSPSGLPALVPAGMRAVAVDVNETSGLSGMLNPGCHVDVIATVTGKDGVVVTRTIVQNVLVQAVGQRLIAETAEPKEAGKPSVVVQKKTFEPYRSVTLITTPKEAEMLQLAATNARMTLALRGSGDEEVYDSEGSKLRELAGLPAEEEQPTVAVNPPADTVVPTPSVTQTSTTQPAQNAIPVRVVTVIQGGKVSTVQFQVPNQPEIGSTDPEEVIPGQPAMKPGNDE
jgi:pilus assembly protein CpaB